MSPKGHPHVTGCCALYTWQLLDIVVEDLKTALILKQFAKSKQLVKYHFPGKRLKIVFVFFPRSDF